jgi:uncharacterized protein (DUF362 family)
MVKVYIEKIREDNERQLEDALAYLDWESIVPSGARVFFKPNLTYPTYKTGVTTSPAFLENVLRVFSNRTSQMIVGESDGGYRGWSAELSFKNHGLSEICNKFKARLINLSHEPTTAVKFPLTTGEKTLQLPAMLLDEIDVFVTLPVPKIHQVTTMSGAIKNQWGVIPDNMRLVYHPDFNEMIFAINELFDRKMAIADGRDFLDQSGPMFGEPVRMDLLLASGDFGGLDTAICQVMDLDIKNIRYLDKGIQRGMVPHAEQLEFSTHPDEFREHTFNLNLTFRNRVVRWAFYRPWAIRLFWNSWFADQLHKLLYALAGNPVEEEVAHVNI